MAKTQDRDIKDETRSDGFRDFIVDFLGCLVPGNIFLFFLAPALLIPIVMSLHSIPWLADQWSFAAPMLQHGAPINIATLLLILLPFLGFWLMLSYVVGFSFYRQNLEDLDKISFMHMPQWARRESMCRALPSPQGAPPRSRVRVSEIPVQFPYHYLRDYLRDRGMTYLAARVPWDASAEDFKRRSKHFANALKMRIRLELPSDYTIVAANEGHIRLASSMWHVFRKLRLLALLGLVTYLATIATVGWAQGKLSASPLAVLPVGVLVIAWTGMRGIEKAFHHQREREIVFILEMANWLCVTNRAPQMFEGLGAVSVVQCQGLPSGGGSEGGGASGSA